MGFESIKSFKKIRCDAMETDGFFLSLPGKDSEPKL